MQCGAPIAVPFRGRVWVGDCPSVTGRKLEERNRMTQNPKPGTILPNPDGATGPTPVARARLAGAGFRVVHLNR